LTQTEVVFRHKVNKETWWRS